MRLIDADAMKKEIHRYALDVYCINLENSKEFAGNSVVENYCEALYEATELIDNLPTIDAEPEKQMPKPPKITLHNGYCGNCGIAWGYDRLKTEEACGFKYFQYCPVCGQAIDWSDE